MYIDTNRIKVIRNGTVTKGTIIYWMSRDIRIVDNWALLYAQQKAFETDSELIIVFNIVKKFLGATLRQYHFMLEGLKECAIKAQSLHIPFIITTGPAEEEIPKIITHSGCTLLVTDFDPLKIKMRWRSNINNHITIPFHMVDTRNIVPCWTVSSKQEWGAYTFRRKINKLLPQYLTEIPPPKRMEQKIPDKTYDWKKIISSLHINTQVLPITWCKPGPQAAIRQLKQFIQHRLKFYSKRNNPLIDAESHLSHYLHFGQISGQRIALSILSLPGEYNTEKELFLEQLIVRRELADNFCYYNSDYDNPGSFPAWAQDTLNIHLADPRDHIYTRNELEAGETHDVLWNAVQHQLVKEGRMHNYLRMYWAKKILEWTSTYMEAMDIAVYLNDTYQLDGRDSNGYTGIAWSIGGVHDRAFSNRAVYGKIRYMSYSGCARKFNIPSYIELIT